MKRTVQEVALKDIRPNPFRYITDYPLSESKLAELVESIEDTGFWTNVCARPVDGHYEIAYGHHRIEAARRAQLKTVPLVIEPDMDDERAFAMMKRENSESYGIAAYADAGVVAGLISGYVDGRLKLKPVHTDTPARTVYLAALEHGRLRVIGPGGKEVEEARSARTGPTFTTSTLAEHLGWTKRDNTPTDRFYAAFNALAHLILPGAVSPADLEGLPQTTVLTIAAEARRQSEQVAKERSEAAFKAVVAPSEAATQRVERLAKKETAVRRDAAQEAIKEARSEEAKREEKRRIRRAASKANPKPTKGPQLIEHYTDALIGLCETISPYEPIIAKAQKLVPYLEEQLLDEQRASRLARSLRKMLERNAKRIELLAEAFENTNLRKVKTLLAG